MPVTEIGHYTDSMGNDLEPRLEAALGVTVVKVTDESVGGTNAEQILARFNAGGAAGGANIIRAGHNNYEDLPPSPTIVQQSVKRNLDAVRSMVTQSGRAIVMQLGTNSRSAYATSGVWLLARQAGEQTNAGFAAEYPPAVYCRIHDRMLAKAAALPDLTAQDRTDIEHRLLPYRWRATAADGGANDGHYNSAGKDVAVGVYVEQINQYNFLGKATAPPPPPPPPAQIPVMSARQAQDAVDAFGMNTHITFQGAGDTNSYEVETVDRLLTLGVRLVRQRLAIGSAPLRASIKRLHDAGVQTILPMLSLSECPSLTAARAQANAYLDEIGNNPAVYKISMIQAFAGPNEPNGDQPTDAQWAQKTRWAMQATYEETRKRAAFAGVLIQGPPLSKPVGARVAAGQTWQQVLTADAAAVGNLSPWVDRADAHIYPGEKDPGNGGPPADFLTILAGMYPAGEPFCISEAGYFNATDDDHGRNYTGGSRPTPETVTAIYAPKHPLTYLALGHGPLVAYEFLENQPPYADTDQGTRESTFGYIYTPSLSPATWLPKLQFTAMQRYLARFSDPGVPFTPTGLRLRITGGPADLRSLLFQKRSGAWVLALWRAVDLYDYDVPAGAGTYLNPAGVTVTVDLAEALTVKTWQPSVQAGPVETLGEVASFTQNFGKQLHLIELNPATVITPPLPPPPPPPTPILTDALLRWWRRIRGYR